MPRGRYNTRQRAEIIGYLKRHAQQRLGVDDLVLRLEAEGVSVGKTTVYRLLGALCEAGEARRYVDAEGATCYQYLGDAEGCGEHAHMVCTRCGDLLHLDCGEVHALAEHLLLEHGFEVDTDRTVLYGRCAGCAQRGEH